MKVILTTNEVAEENIRTIKPNEIILEAPTLDQIASLVRLGYEPPNLNQRMVMHSTALKVPFPDVISIRCAIAESGWEAIPYKDIFKWFNNQTMDTLIDFGFLEEGLEDMYAFHPLVMKMEFTALECRLVDNLANELQNGRDFNAYDAT